MLPVNVVALPITTRPASSAAIAAGSPLARTGMSNRRPMRDRPGGMSTRKVRATSRVFEGMDATVLIDCLTGSHVSIGCSVCSACAISERAIN